MRMFFLALGLAMIAVVFDVLNLMMLTTLGFVGVLALIGVIVVVGWPERPPQRGAVGYRKDDMDWPAEDVMEGEWTDAGRTVLYLAAPEEGGAL